MLSVDEAIKHCRHTVYCLKNDNSIIQFGNCIESYEQLAEWLEELKMLRELKEEHRKIGNIEGFNKGYNKAIDDFVNSLKKLVEQELSFPDLSFECKKCGIWKIKDVESIAEQLKAGERE